MGPTLVLARNGIRRGLRSRTLLLMGVVGPLVLGAVLALAFGGSGPSISIGLVDLDGSDLSTQIGQGLVDALDGSQLDLEVLDARADGDLSDVRQLVSDGDVGAVLVIPSGYGASVSRTPEPLGVIGAGDNNIARSVVEGIARQIASTTDLQRAVAVGYVIAGGEMPAATRLGAGGQVEPALTTEAVDFTEPFDAPMYFGPLAVFLFLGLGVSARTLLRDQTDGILDRVRAAPVSTRQVVGGSVVAVLVQGALASATVILLSTLVFGASWGATLEVVVVVGAFVVSVAGLLGLVVGVAGTELQAESWTNVLAFGFAIVGGSFFGGTLLPGLLGLIGMLTPNGAAMRALIEVGPGGQSLLDIWYLLAWMFAVGIVGVVAGSRLLRRRLR